MLLLLLLLLMMMMMMMMMMLGMIGLAVSVITYFPYFAVYVLFYIVCFVHCLMFNTCVIVYRATVSAVSCLVVPVFICVCILTYCLVLSN